MNSQTNFETRYITRYRSRRYPSNWMMASLLAVTVAVMAFLACTVADARPFEKDPQFNPYWAPFGREVETRVLHK